MEEVKFKGKDNHSQMTTEEKVKEPNMKDKVDEMYEALKDVNKKKIKIPRKAKVRKGNLKKGFIGVLHIDENGNIYGDKQKVSGGAFSSDKGKYYHATDGREILFWQGKFPVIIQPTWRKNPINVRDLISQIKLEDGSTKFIVNETYGQQYIKARMLADIIKVKGAGGSALFWLIGIAIAGYLAYSAFTGGL